MTPALHILGLTMPAAVATSLTQMVGASLSGSYKHFKQGNVSIRLALLFGLPSLVGISVGRRLLLTWPLEHAENILTGIYLALAVSICLDQARKFLRSPGTPSSALLQGERWGPRLKWDDSRRSVAILPSIGLGIGIGLLSSLTGLGGGFLYVPALTGLAACSIKEAIATSLAAVFLSSVYGAVIYGAAGVSHIPVALLLMVGAVAGAQLGALATQRTEVRRLQLFFILLVLAAMSSIVLKRLGWTTAAHIALFGTGGSLILSTLCSLGLQLRKKSSSVIEQA